MIPAAKNLFTKIAANFPDFDRELVQKAVDFAIKYHGEQKRHSGDPYYHHPLEVAEILAEMKFDVPTIITGLLHDTVEDTPATLDDIKSLFGERISQLVDGVTKLTKIEFQSDNHKQAENFRKLLIATSEDIRVLVVKLADRLHNIRTLHFINDPEKRKRIAKETLEIYAILAERIGMHKLKDELQEIAFQELYPDAYKSITSRLELLRESGSAQIERTVNNLKKLLSDANINAEVYGREKAPFSIWRKMQRKNMSFEQLTDVVAFRIIVNTKDECYRTLGVIHDTLHMIPEGFRDYISTMKNNGYQSLHTVVVGPELNKIEIQIRTHKMHEIAEYGVAAHWTYKQDQPYSIDGRKFRWIREMLNIIEQGGQDPEEFLQNTKMEMYKDQVFCFTPKGELIALPKGATPVDFAFAVHSEVGRVCAGAKVNGKIVPLRTQLRNGDQIEIIQAKTNSISPAWESFVVTGKALAEVRKFVRTQKRQEYIKLGKEILERSFHNLGSEFNDKVIEPALKKLNRQSVDDIYAGLGEGTLHRNEVLKELFPDKYKLEGEKKSFFERFRWKKPGKVEKLSVPISGLIPGMAVHFAGCCHPLPGENIAGIVNTGKGITIHTSDCPELEQFVNQPERWIDVTWEKKRGKEAFVGRIKVALKNKKGSLGALANAIAKAGGNIINLRIINRSEEFFDIIVDIELLDIEHLNTAIALLRTKKAVHSVERYKEGG